jgi:hypothetical protein
MLWGSALVGSQVIKGIGTLPQYSVGNNSSNYMALYQERSSKITSSVNADVCSRIVNYLVFLLYFCNSSISYFSWSHMDSNQVALVVSVLFSALFPG